MVLPILAAGAVSSGVLIMALAVIGLLIFLAMTTKMEGIMLLVFPVAIIYLLVQD